MTVGSTGIRGYKWRLESTGAGAVAGGNIVWDASGNVTFAASVSLQWTAPIDSITTALGGNTYPKLTKITAAGIYTGSITAGQITAGTISADRIAAAASMPPTGYGQRESLAGYGRQHRSPYAECHQGQDWRLDDRSDGIERQHILLDSGNRRLVVYG